MQKVIDTLAKDLKVSFPEMSGLSSRNLRYMRDFAQDFPSFPNWQGDLAKLSWHHHMTLIDKVKDLEIRKFYVQQTAAQGWSRDVMVHQIEVGLHKRIGNLQNNFVEAIPDEGSELVRQIFKDPYKFDFIYLGQEAKEKDLEDALTSQLSNMLLELGQHFAFIGRQYKIMLGEKE